MPKITALRRAETINPDLNLGVLCQGQGSQHAGMFKELLSSPIAPIKQAAQEILEGILKPAAPEIFDVYYGENVSGSKINSAVNVQPATAAATMVWRKALENMLGQELAADVASGYSLGAFVATYMLNVLSPEQLLHLTVLRGKVFSPIEPGQFKVITLVTNETAHVRTLNWKHLRGTGYRVTIRNAPDVVTIAGPADKKDVLEARLAGLQQDGTVKLIKWLDGSVYYVPFHHYKELSDVAGFFKSQLDKYCKRETAATGVQVFKKPRGIFVTNDGRRFTDAADVREYFAAPQIANLCNFDGTMQIIGRLATTVIGLGNLSYQLGVAQKHGYIKQFIVVNDAAGLGAAARAYEALLGRREQAGVSARPATAARHQLQLA